MSFLQPGPSVHSHGLYCQFASSELPRYLRQCVPIDKPLGISFLMPLAFKSSGPSVNMIVSPSRRLRIYGAIAILTLIATYLHTRPRWNESPFEYARDYYESVTNYFGGPVYNNTLYTEGNAHMVNQYYNSSNPCANFPDTDGVMLVMKTGATEVFDRMPTHLLTTLKCLPDFLIFSDMVRPLFFVSARGATSSAGPS